jgi:hypothetical protein
VDGLMNQKNATLKLQLKSESGYESNETVKISALQWESILRIINGNEIDYKAKYEKCIQTIKKFDAGIIGMYDL